MNIRKALILSLCVCNCAAAQQDALAQTQAPQEEPEKIVVIGERSATLHVQLMEYERMAYDIFNQFNDEERFIISCSVGAPTGSRFTRQVCQPEFEIAATRGHAQDYYDSMPRQGRGLSESVVRTRQPMEVEILRQQAEYRLKMKQVAEEHPEFLEAIKRYAELQQEFEEGTEQTHE